MNSKTTLCSSWLLVLLWASGAGAQVPLDERGLEHKACNRPVERSLARAARTLAAAEHTSAGVAPNPRIEAQHLRTLDGPVDRETVVGLAVPVVLSGRRGVLRDAARARGREGEASVRARRFEVVIEARRLYARAIVARARQVVLARQQRALDALTAALGDLARGGEAAHYDSLRQGLEAQVHRQSLVRADAEASASEQALEAWLGEPVTLPALEKSGLAASDPRNDRSGEHPALASLRASAEASELEARAARRRAVPDPELFAGYRQIDVEGSTGRGIALGVSLPLPLFDHGQGDAARAGAAAARARAELAAERRRFDTLARAERVRLSRLESALGRAGDAARDAERLRDGAKKLYAAGELSIVELLDAYRAAEALELARLDTVLEAALSRIELARARGAGIERACRGAR